MHLGIGSVLERLVLKNDAECTSQRLKWTSGARFMIIFGRSVAQSLGRSVAVDTRMFCDDKTPDMSLDHKTCLVITRHGLWSQDMS